MKQSMSELQKLAASLYSQENLGELTEYIVKVCRNVFNVIHVAVFYYNVKWDEFSGTRPGDSQEIHFPGGEGLAGTVAEAGECLLVENVSESPLFREDIDGIEKYSPNDILSAPLLTADDELKGVIQLVDKKHGSFGTEDEDLFTAFCSMAAEAVTRSKHTEELNGFSKSILENISYSIDAKYAVTVGHTWRVRDMAVSLAQAMDLSENRIRNIEYAALLHNVGRLAYNSEITDIDPAVETGRRQLFTEAVIRDISFPSQLDMVKDIVLHCNEHADGTGTPEGLSGNDIPLGSRIIAVCSMYDCAYFQGAEDVARYSEKAAIAYVNAKKGTLLDDDVVDAFMEKRIYEKEKRRHKRVEYTGEAEVTLLNEHGAEAERFTTKLLDMSSGGILFFSEKRLDINLMVKLRISLVTGLMSAIVRVARVTEHEKGGFKIGAYFVWSSSRSI